MPVMAAMPLSVMRGLGDLTGWLVYVLPIRSSQISRRNIELCFPEMDATQQRRLVRKSLRNDGRTMLEMPRLWRRHQTVNLDIGNFDEVRQRAETEGKGALILAPHLGSWEALTPVLHQLPGFAYLYRPPDNPMVARLIVGQRAQSQAEAVPADSSGMRRLFRIASAGRCIGILPDQKPKRGGKGVDAPFFGIPTPTMVLVAKLIQRYQMPSYYAVCLREGGRYRVLFEPTPAEIADPDPLASASAMNLGIEQLVRRCPEQYQWSYRRFPRALY